MFTFSKSDRIDTTKIEDESLFLIFVVGLINQHLNMLPINHKHKNKFRVEYQWGGAGHDFIDIYPLHNLKASICMGVAGGRLGYNIFLDTETAELAPDEGGELQADEVSLDDIVNFLETFVREWFVEDKISQYPQFVAPEG